MSRFVAFDVETPNRVSNTKSDRRKCLSLIWISECAEVLNRSPIRRLINLIVVAQKKLDFRIYVYTTFDIHTFHCLQTKQLIYKRLLGGSVIPT